MSVPNYQHLIPEDFNPNSRVWIYQASRPFGISEALKIESMLENFIQNWKSHGHAVKGYGNLFLGQFVVLMADETAVTVGGCSTDSSVHLIKAIEQEFGVNMFDRQTLAFYIKDKVQLLPMSQLSYGVTNGFITPDTLYFNNLVNTKAAFLNIWITPVKNSWLNAKLPSMA
jgi:hypothetical protein